jgi:hypothetical protein
MPRYRLVDGKKVLVGKATATKKPELNIQIEQEPKEEKSSFKKNKRRGDK